MLACMIIGLACGVQTAGPMLDLQATTDLDRWMYPFNGTPGTRAAAPTFGAVGQGAVGEFGFDERDGQFLIGFDPTPVFPSGLPACRYVIDDVVVRATVSTDLAFGYDPTQDTYCTYITDTEHPDYCGGDTDVGIGDIETARPIELFGVAYRGGYGAVDSDAVVMFQESSPFGPILQDARNAYPIDGNEYPSNGTDPMTDDVSNNVRDQYNPEPWAIGLNSALTPGQAVPADTEFTFDLDPVRLLPGEKMYEYLRQGLRDGRLNFMITSLQPASSSGGVGTGEYATFSTREDTIFGIPATIEILGSLYCDADANTDGAVDVNDISFVLFRLGGSLDDGCGCLEGDANGDGIVDVNDISYVLFRLGTPCP